MCIFIENDVILEQYFSIHSLNNFLKYFPIKIGSSLVLSYYILIFIFSKIQNLQHARFVLKFCIIFLCTLSLALEGLKKQVNVESDTLRFPKLEFRQGDATCSDYKGPIFKTLLRPGRNPPSNYILLCNSKSLFDEFYALTTSVKFLLIRNKH